jgi:hypothetical protein
MQSLNLGCNYGSALPCEVGMHCTIGLTSATPAVRGLSLTNVADTKLMMGLGRAPQHARPISSAMRSSNIISSRA